MTSTDQPADLDGFTAHYGVRITFVGDDGDRVVALGHIEPRRMLAALNRKTRVDLGWKIVNEWPYRDTEELLGAFEEHWATLKTRCDDYPHPDEPSCGECREIQAADWWLDWSDTNTADTPGAFPVTVLDT